MDKVDQDLLMCRYWNMARMQTMSPKVVKSHQSQVLSVPVAKSVECLTIRVHLAKERPNPARAPYLKKKISLLIQIGTQSWKKNLTKLQLFDKSTSSAKIQSNWKERKSWTQWRKWNRCLRVSCHSDLQMSCLTVLSRRWATSKE